MRIAYINIADLGFTPKLFGFFYSLTASGTGVRSAFFVNYIDSSGRTIRSDTFTSGTSNGAYIGLVPSNTVRIEVWAGYYSGAGYSVSITLWIDNAFFATDGSISIHATPVLFYNVPASYDIPINKTLLASASAAFTRIFGYSPPPNTSVTPTLYYDSSTASPSATSMLTINSSVLKMSYSGSSATNNEQKFSVDAYAIYIVQPPNIFIDLIVIWLNVNTSPQKPELVIIAIPSPASNYTVPYTASLLIQHNTTPNLATQASFSLSISGDAPGITYAKIQITVKDPIGNVVYDDYFEVQSGSVTKTPATLNILPNVTYSLIYTVNITASPAQQTVISVSVQYTTQPQVS